MMRSLFLLFSWLFVGSVAVVCGMNDEEAERFAQRNRLTSGKSCEILKAVSDSGLLEEILAGIRKGNMDIVNLCIFLPQQESSFPVANRLIFLKSLERSIKSGKKVLSHDQLKVICYWKNLGINGKLSQLSFFPSLDRLPMLQ